MNVRVVTDGKDPLTKPTVDYLERQYPGITPSIKGLTLEANHGDIQLVTVTLMVEVENSDLSTDRSGAVRE